MIYCPKCGAANEPGYDVCWRCKTSLHFAGEAHAQPGAAPRPGTAPQPGVAPQPGTRPVAPSNGLSTAGLVLGIISLALFWVVYLSLPMSILGLVFSARSMKYHYRFCSGGLTLNIIALALGVIFLIVGISSCVTLNWYGLW